MRVCLAVKPFAFPMNSTNLRWLAGLAALLLLAFRSAAPAQSQLHLVGYSAMLEKTDLSKPEREQQQRLALAARPTTTATSSRAAFASTRPPRPSPAVSGACSTSATRWPTSSSRPAARP